GAALLPPTGNSLAIRPEVVNGNVISGIRGSATSFLLDGVDVSEQHQGGTFIQTSIDALQEFSIQQSPYSAEYNRGGAFFNATTRALYLTTLSQAWHSAPATSAPRRSTIPPRPARSRRATTATRLEPQSAPSYAHRFSTTPFQRPASRPRHSQSKPTFPSRTQ